MELQLFSLSSSVQAGDPAGSFHGQKSLPVVSQLGCSQEKAKLLLLHLIPLNRTGNVLLASKFHEGSRDEKQYLHRWNK